jgi:ATP-dependent helicase/DNAse subunit B
VRPLAHFCNISNFVESSTDIQEQIERRRERAKPTRRLRAANALPKALPLPRNAFVRQNRRGALGVEVHTFHTLYAEILTRAGSPIPLLPDAVRIRLLRSLVDDLCKRGVMTHFSALRDKPGFIALLRNTIEELKRARIFPDHFSASVEGMGARLEEIALVYSARQDWLQRENWADNEGRGWLAAIALESSPDLKKVKIEPLRHGDTEFNNERNLRDSVSSW